MGLREFLFGNNEREKVVKKENENQDLIDLIDDVIKDKEDEKRIREVALEKEEEVIKSSPETYNYFISLKEEFIKEKELEKIRYKDACDSFIEEAKIPEWAKKYIKVSERRLCIIKIPHLADEIVVYDSLHFEGKIIEFFYSRNYGSYGGWKYSADSFEKLLKLIIKDKEIEVIQ